MDMDRKELSLENADVLPPKGHPMQETVYYQIGGTVYEVATSCGGTESLPDKMHRLLKSETPEITADKEL